MTRRIETRTATRVHRTLIHRTLIHTATLVHRTRVRTATLVRRMLVHTATPALALALALALAATMVAIAAGCGESTKTVSAASAPPARAGSTSAQATDAGGPAGGGTGPSGTSTGTTGTSAAGGTPAGTRTAGAPAFVEGGKETAASGEGLSGALAVVRAHGYTASKTSDYRPSQTLRVLIGTGSHSNDGYDKQAFFFVDGRYIGTDASSPSAQVSVVSQSDTEVVLAYALYRAGDPLCCPGGGQAKVRFQLNNGRLVPLDPIPPVGSATGLSRQ